MKLAEYLNYWDIDKYLAYVQKKYDISRSEYFTLEDKQKGLCAICGQDEKLRVDHNHKCKRHPEDKGCRKCIRGLLCSFCNGMLGRAEKRPWMLQAMMKYLRVPKSILVRSCTKEKTRARLIR